MSRAIRHPGLHDSSGSEIPGRLIEVSGVDTYVYDHGNGPVLFFLHGYGDTADGWRKTVPSVADKFRVVAIDLPPFGRSEDPNRLRPTPHLTEFYKEFFPELFETLGIESATFIGHSLGGGIALEAALERPEMVDKLVVVAPAGLDSGAPLWWKIVANMGGPSGLFLRYTGPIAPQLRRIGVKSFVQNVVVHPASNLNGDLDYLVDTYSHGRNLHKLLAAGKSLIGGYTGDLIQRAAGLDRETLAVWGRQDALVPVEQARALAKNAWRAKIAVIEKCGHYPQIEKPGQFNRILGRFLASQPQRRVKKIAS